MVDGNVWHASFGGGTNIFIKGQGLAENPSSNLVILEAQDFDNKPKFVAPKLNADDEFLSATPMGFIVYRVPAPHTLMGVSQESLWNYERMTFKVSLHAFAIGGAATLNC